MRTHALYVVDFVFQNLSTGCEDENVEKLYLNSRKNRFNLIKFNEVKRKINENETIVVFWGVSR
jgi:hypothetical protein